MIPFYFALGNTKTIQFPVPFDARIKLVEWDAMLTPPAGSVTNATVYGELKLVQAQVAYTAQNASSSLLLSMIQATSHSDTTQQWPIAINKVVPIDYQVTAGQMLFASSVFSSGSSWIHLIIWLDPVSALPEPRGSDVPIRKPLALDPVLNSPIDVALSKRVMKSSAGQQCCRINASIINGEISKGLGGLLDALTKPSGTVLALLAVNNRLRVITLAEAAATTAVLGEAFVVASAIELATLAKAAAIYETLSVVQTIIGWVFSHIDTCGICCLARSLPQNHRRQRQRVKILRRL